MKSNPGTVVRPRSVRSDQDLCGQTKICAVRPRYVWSDHRLRPIDTHLALYTMLYTNSAKNRYAEPVHNKTKQISKIRD